MIEKLVNFKIAIRHKKPKSEVKEKFLEYSRAYDEKAGERTIKDKLEYRDLHNIYLQYMAGSGKNE